MYSSGRDAALRKYASEFVKIALGQRQALRIQAALSRMGKSLPLNDIIHDPVYSPVLYRADTHDAREMDLAYALRANSSARKRGRTANPVTLPATVQYEADRLRAQQTSGRHQLNTHTFPGRNIRTQEQFDATAGTRPEEFMHRGNTPEFDPEEPGTMRHVSANPSIAASYGPNLSTYRVPAELPPEQMTPWQAHFGGIDDAGRPRGMPDAHPQYERLVQQQHLAPNLVARYKQLPLTNEYQQVAGQRDILSLPPANGAPPVAEPPRRVTLVGE